MATILHKAETNMALSQDPAALGLTPDDLLKMYSTMLLSRKLDERAWVMHRQGRVAFHISAMGHEAAQMGLAYALRPGFDWVYPYYRDLTLVLALGMTPREFMLGLFGKKGDPNSGARQMPSHWGYRKLKLVTTSSPVATQVPQAAGTALAEVLKQRRGLNKGQEMAVTVACLGEGSTSEGDFHEALSWAGVHKLPFICYVQNNIYAISVPQEKQMAVPNVSDRACAYGIAGVTVDGNDVLAVYDASRQAVQRARSGQGATLLEAKCYRPVPHSSDDDDRTYRSREEVEQWKQRDPILRLRTYLESEGILTPEIQAGYDKQITTVVDDANKFADEAPYPEPVDEENRVYAP